MSYNSAITDAQIRATPLPVSGTVTVTPSGTQTVAGSVSITGAVAVTGTFYQATQPVSGTVTVGNASLAVTGTFFQATQPISAASLPLPTGAATETTLAALNTKTPALGQATMANSQPVVIASNQSSINVSDVNASTGPTAFTTSDAVGGAPDGVGTPINAASTAGSIVSITVPAGMESWTMQMTAYGTGAVYTEASVDSTNGTDGNWVAVKGRRTGTSVGVESVVYTMVANGTYRGNCAGFTYLRARLIGTGTPSIKFILSAGSGATFLNSGIPSGTSSIGTVILGAGSAAVGSVSSVDTTASGTITAISQNVALALNGKSGAAIQITGTWVGTLQFEGTVDGTTWSTINGVYAGASTPTPTITANGLVRLTPSGLAQFRVTATAWTSGTATISMRASDATGGTFINQSLTAGTNVIGKVGIDQTTPGTTNLVSIGTNGVVALGAGASAIGSVTVTGTTAVSGTFFQATQPVSAASLPLPAGAATETTLAALNTKVTAVNTGAVTISAALPAGTNLIGDTNGRQFVASADTTLQSAAVAVGNGTVLTTTGYGTALIQITGTFVGTVTFEATEDGTNYTSISAVQVGTSLISTTATVPGIYRLASVGMTNIRARISAYTSGSITALGRTTNAPFGIKVVALAAGANTIGTVIATQAMANATTGDTGAKTATGNGATQTNAGNKGVQILIALGAVSGTTPTAVFKVQGSVDGGTTFYDIPGATTASLTATGNFGIMVYPGAATTAGTTTSGATATASMGLPRTWRLVWTIGGTTPSFAITAVQYNYLPN